MQEVVEFRVGEAPASGALQDLRRSVGWDAAEKDYPRAFGRYSTMVAGYTPAGVLVAWAALISDDVRHAFFVDVIVHPDYQRQGNGRRLVKEALRAEHARGTSLIHVDFAAEHTEFYRACGFTTGGGGFHTAS
jgi:GNAT superfamily N-acetyltransferase